MALTGIQIKAQNRNKRKTALIISSEKYKEANNL